MERKTNRFFYMIGYGARSAVHEVASAAGGTSGAIANAGYSTKQGWLDKVTMLQAQAAQVRASGGKGETIDSTAERVAA